MLKIFIWNIFKSILKESEFKKKIYKHDLIVNYIYKNVVFHKYRVEVLINKILSLKKRKYKQNYEYNSNNYNKLLNYNIILKVYLYFLSFANVNYSIF